MSFISSLVAASLKTDQSVQSNQSCNADMAPSGQTLTCFKEGFVLVSSSQCVGVNITVMGEIIQDGDGVLLWIFDLSIGMIQSVGSPRKVHIMTENSLGRYKGQHLTVRSSMSMIIMIFIYTVCTLYVVWHIYCCPSLEKVDLWCLHSYRLQWQQHVGGSVLSGNNFHLLSWCTGLHEGPAAVFICTGSLSLGEVVQLIILSMLYFIYHIFFVFDSYCSGCLSYSMFSDQCCVNAFKMSQSAILLMLRRTCVVMLHSQVGWD